MIPALILIDMQRGMSTAAAGVRNNPHAERTMLMLLTAWRKAQGTVIHVRHISATPGSLFWPGGENAGFQEALAPLAFEHVVDKRVNDAFINTGLEAWLRARGIEQLVITGVSTNNSVEAAARSAGCLGFNTIVVSDATFAFAKKDYIGTMRSAAEVHAMSLAKLQHEYATILCAEETLNLVRELASPL